MFEMTRHHLRQLRYRWLSWRAEPLYLLLERMYQCDPTPLANVTPHPQQRGFLLTNFSCPDFARYRGREIAFFNQRQVAVYWLPGAQHSGGGHVPSGDYNVTVDGHALRRAVQLQVSKDDEQTRICSVTVPQRRSRSVQGGFISFAIITRELHYLALHWLEQMPARLEDVEDVAQLHEVLGYAQRLPGQVQLNVKVKALLAAVQARQGGCR